MIHSSACQPWPADHPGPCRRASRPSLSYTTPRGTIAPEQDERLGVADFPSDTYSFAVVAYQLLGGSVPKGTPFPKLSEVNRRVPLAVSDTLAQCLSRRMEHRPHASEVARVFRRHSSNVEDEPATQSEFPLPQGVRPFFGDGRLYAGPLYIDEASLILRKAPSALEYMGVSLKLLTIPEFADAFSKLHVAKVLILDSDSKSAIKEASKVLRHPIARIQANLATAEAHLGGLRIVMGKRLQVRRLSSFPPFRFSLLDRKYVYVRNYQSRTSGSNAPIWEAERGPFLEGIVRMHQFYWETARPEVK